jgi:putative phage-type endonuclease
MHRPGGTVTATLLLPHDAPRGEWLARRQAGIGASEIAAVMGISPYDSPFSLWWKKHMGWSTDTNEEMRIGSHLEDAIASWFEEESDPLQNLVFRPAGLFASAERPWQVATPDRLVYLPCLNCDGEGFLDPDDPWAICLEPGCRSGASGDPVALLECKWVAARWDGWGEEGSGEVPVHYRAQALWQMDVMEVDEVFFCALGPGGFRSFRVRRDEKDLVMMREAGRRFMDSLEEGIPPDVDDHDATLPMLRRVIGGDIEDREEEIPHPIATGWLRAKDFKALATSVEKRYSAALRAHLGTAKTALLDGRKIASRSTDDKLMRSKTR